MTDERHALLLAIAVGLFALTFLLLTACAVRVCADGRWDTDSRYPINLAATVGTENTGAAYCGYGRPN